MALSRTKHFRYNTKENDKLVLYKIVHGEKTIISHAKIEKNIYKTKAV